MKKLLTIIALSLSILITSIALSNLPQSIILYVTSSNLDQATNLYNSTALDENNLTYNIESSTNLSNTWLNATIKNTGEIPNYTIMD